MVDITNIPTVRGLVDWDNDGDFGGDYEDITEFMSARPGLSITVGKDSARSLAPPRFNEAEVDLKNRDQTFSPEAPSSPLYTLVKPGRDVEFRVTGGDDVNYDDDVYYDDEVTYQGTYEVSLFTGQTVEFPQAPELAVQRVKLRALGSMSLLRGRRKNRRLVSTELYESITTGQAVGYVLDAAGWPSDRRDIDTGVTTLLYWWLDGEEPYQALLDLLAVEGPQASLYEDGEGIIHFEDRTYRSLTTRSAETQAIYYDTSAATVTGYEDDIDYNSENAYNGEGGIYHVRPFSYDQGLKNVINSCSMETVQRAAQAVAVVWTYGGGTFAIQAGETVVIVAKPDDPFKSAVCTNGVDVTFSGTLSSVTLNRTSGGNVQITLVASVTGNCSLLRLRAAAVTVSSKARVVNSVDASSSIADYEQQDYKISGRQDISVAMAQSLVDAIVTRYQTPQALVSVTISNHNYLHVYEQLWRRISDRVTIFEEHTGVSWDAHINTITYRFLEGGLIDYVTLGCEKAPISGDDQVWLWADASAPDPEDSVWDTAEWVA